VTDPCEEEKGKVVPFNHNLAHHFLLFNWNVDGNMAPFLCGLGGVKFVRCLLVAAGEDSNLKLQFLFVPLFNLMILLSTGRALFG
jgi:hypothetical protein